MIVADHALYHGRKVPTISTSLHIVWDDADDIDYGGAGNAKLAIAQSLYQNHLLSPAPCTFSTHFSRCFVHVFEISSHSSSTAKINLTAYLLIGYTPQQDI